jgi:hypothetical protein
MRIHPGRTIRRALLVSGALLGVTVLVASPASAAVNDNFYAQTTDGCGVVNFIDYGPGAPGGGDNDDYTVIHDYCADGHGVRAWTWLDGVYLGSMYNGNGQAGSPVVWDPYKPYGNVGAGDLVELIVCLVDGSGDTTGARCGYAAHTSADG